MSHQIGILELYDCITKQNHELLDWCIEFMLKILMALIILICSIYILIVRRKTCYHSFLTRKQIIMLLLVIDLLVYLFYQLGAKLPSLYFPIPYFQFMFIAYVIYYFGRKSILLASFHQQGMINEISSNMQMKLAQLMYFGLVFFFSIIFILNYIDYFLHSSTYSLCQCFNFNYQLAQFFNIITTIGFLLQALFFLQIRQLTRQVTKNMKKDLLSDIEILDFTNVVIRRLKKIWILVIVNVVGSFISFVQNLYFVIMNSILSKEQEIYTCYYVNLPQNEELSNLVNSIIDLIDKIFSFFLPYFFALIVFWPVKKKFQDQTDSQEAISTETYVIKNKSQEFSDQNMAST